MTEPNNQNITCPRCRHDDVHFSSEIGFYCTSCGHRFNSDESRVLVEHQVLQSKSGSSG